MCRACLATCCKMWRVTSWQSSILFRWSWAAAGTNTAELTTFTRCNCGILTQQPASPFEEHTLRFCGVLGGEEFYDEK